MTSPAFEPGACLSRARINQWIKQIDNWTASEKPNLIDVYTGYPSPNPSDPLFTKPRSISLDTNKHTEALQKIALADLLQKSRFKLLKPKANDIIIDALDLDYDSGSIILKYMHKKKQASLHLATIPSNPTIVIHRPLQFDQLRMLEPKDGDHELRPAIETLREHLKTEIATKKDRLETRNKQLLVNGKPVEPRVFPLLHNADPGADQATCHSAS
ncbi:MAG: hypothetical protein HOA17_03285 [Candidatus Melainabacteria bacterium]|jgi:hypothetical protein|nr:hypothetical protein [Candidatus Melainabacteria bacterium]